MDFKMKRIIKPFVPALMPICILLLGIMASCTSDDDSGGGATTGISLHIQAATRAADGSVNTGSKAENSINNVGVWFFAENAMDGDQALYYAQQSVSADNGELLLNFSDEELRLHHEMNSEGSYQLFVVANLPADAAIGATTTLNELKNYSYSATARPGSPFCMTGSTNGAHNFGTDSRVSIPLVRVASRLDIKVINETGKTLQVNKISIADDQQSVQLFAPVSGSAAQISKAFVAAMDIYTTAVTADKVTCSGYIYENRSTGATKVVIEGNVAGAPRIWTVPIMPNGSAMLLRNSICDITLNLKDAPTPTDINFTISEWNKEPINTSFTNTYIDVDKTNVEVFYVQGGVLRVQSNASTIHVNWEGAPGFYLAGYEDVTEAELPMSSSHAALTFYFQGASDAIIPDGTVTVTTGNLKKTVTLKQVIGNLVFKPRLSISGHEINEGDVIPGDLWGSKKIEEPLYVICYANITWAYKCVGYSVPDGNDIFEFEGRCIYGGTLGDSSPSLTGDIPVFEPEIADRILPINVTVKFYLNSSVPPYNGVVLSQIHFTIVKK